MTPASDTQPGVAGDGPVVFNPLLPEYIRDPHPLLHRLRAEDPVHFSPIMGVWVLTLYADCVAVLHDQRFSAETRHWKDYERFYRRPKPRTSSSPTEAYSRWMVQMDPPDHTRLRGLVAKAFAPRLIEAMRPNIQRIVHELLDSIPSDKQFDVISEFAYPLPIRVISEILGVPEEDHDRIKDWSVALLPSFSPAMSLDAARGVNAAIEEFGAYFVALAGERRRQPRPDLLSELIAARDDRQQLGDDELVAICILLTFAGHATTVQLIGNGVLALLNHPDQLALLRREPERMETALDEVLRFESPVQLVCRTTLEPVVLAGKTIPSNQMVFVSLAAANRDPEQFSDPDRFDITRTGNRHIAFGHGIHFCLGAPLARLEATIALDTLLKRYPRMTMHDRDVQRESSLLLRGLKSLRINLAEHMG